MRDPHITHVHFNVSSDEGISYRNPSPLSFSNRIGEFNLVNGQLDVEPSQHFATEVHARKVIEPFLWAWEIYTDLKGKRGEIRFTFDHVELVDRNPPPPSANRTVLCETARFVVTGNPASIHITRTKYPPPPNSFEWSEKLRLTYDRWKGYLAGRESLQQMAYFIYDYLKNIPGGRKGRIRTL